MQGFIYPHKNIQMLYLNISTDEVILQDKTQNQKIHRNEVEKQLGPILIKRHKKQNYKQIIVVNWPWWFTNLRVWTLMINLLNKLNWDKIIIRSISKIQIFQYFYKQNILPRCWAIYIWQKKNIWLYDLKEDSYKTINKQEILEKDMLKKDILDWAKLFLDEVVFPGYFEDSSILPKISLHYHPTWLSLNYNNKLYTLDIDNFPTKIPKQQTIKPKYLVNPVLN